MSSVARLIRSLPSLVLFALLACGDSGPSGPPTPANLTPVQGDNQTAAVGSDIILQVRVLDGSGQPISGSEVVWAVTAGGGSLSASTSTTTSGGTATTTWTLGGTAGVQSVRATAGSATTTFNATATPGAAASVTVTPDVATLNALQETVQLAITAEDASGNPLVNPNAAFSSDAPEVASVDTNGLVTALSNGVATITASVGSANESAAITVAQVADDVDVVPGATTMEVGAGRAFEAEVRDANGFLIEGSSVAWSTSDAGVASVDAAGNVTAQAAGQAQITGIVDGVNGTADIDVIAAQGDLEPTVDQDLEGDLDVGDLTIPDGVTVTVTDDLLINAAGPVDIAGTLQGDCVSISIVGQQDVTVTGTIDNSCDTDPEAEGEDLELIGNGQLAFEDADITSSGDVVIQNDPTLTEDDFDDLGAVASFDDEAEINGFGCALNGADLTPDPIQAPTSSVTGQGRDAKDWVLRCRGDVSLAGGTVIRGQDGGDSAAEVKNTVANGKDGGDAKELKVRATGNLITGGGGVTFVLGDGGRGADATANGVGTGGNATATGGDGGKAGSLDVRVGGGIVIGNGEMTIDAGDGGIGGDATANATDGALNEKGGDASATGGKGQNSLKARIRARGEVSGTSTISFTGGDAGAGGDAKAKAGRGGDGTEADPPGAEGGKMTAIGGDGGDAEGQRPNPMPTLPDIPFGMGGIGGHIEILGGRGGDGWDDCQPGNFKPGGKGGKGGDAMGMPGEGGDGFTETGTPEKADNGGVAIQPDTGDGGTGGDGPGFGAGGDPGTNSIDNKGATPAPNGPAFEPGMQGNQCDNQPPVADNNGGTVDKGGMITLLMPASDPDGDNLTFTIVQDPMYGTLDLGTITAVTGGATIKYTAGSMPASDSFKFMVDDGRGGTAMATVFVEVVNTPPVFNDDNSDGSSDGPEELATPVNTPLENFVVPFTDANGDEMMFMLLSGPSVGTLDPAGPDLGSGTTGPTLTYTPPEGFQGVVELVVQADDKMGGVVEGVVVITVGDPGANNDPVTDNIVASTDPANPKVLMIPATDVDDDPLSFTVKPMTGPNLGTLSVAAPAPGGFEMLYTPTTAMPGDIDMFEFTIEDGQGGMAMGKATINITSNDMIIVSDAEGLKYQWRNAFGSDLMSIGVPGSAGFGFNPEYTDLYVTQTSSGGVYRVPLDPVSGFGTPSHFSTLLPGLKDVGVRYTPGPVTILPVNMDGSIYFLNMAGGITGDIHVDPGANKIEIPEGTTKAFVTAPGDTKIMVLTGAPPSGRADIPLPLGHAPVDMAVSKDKTKVYILTTNGSSEGILHVYDIASMMVVKTIPTSGIASGVSVTPNGSEALVANHELHKVGVLDTGTDDFKAGDEGLIDIGISFDYALGTGDNWSIMLFRDTDIRMYDRWDASLNPGSIPHAGSLNDMAVGIAAVGGSY